MAASYVERMGKWSPARILAYGGYGGWITKTKILNDLPGGHWNLESGKIWKYIEAAEITLLLTMGLHMMTFDI